jgi:hypothetical protein
MGFGESLLGVASLIGNSFAELVIILTGADSGRLAQCRVLRSRQIGMACAGQGISPE